MKKKKLLITGSNGLLGQKLIEALATNEQFETFATSRGQNRSLQKAGYTYLPLDITDKANVDEVMNQVKPEVMIHTAAMTNVDACELDKEACRKMNIEAMSYLVEACEHHHTHLIHVSTDFIFDGTHGPLTEEEKPNPVSYYGQSKWEGEQLVMQADCPWAIARTVLVYGVVNDMSRSNIVLWAKNSLEQGKQINVVDDQFRTPTLAEDLADGCIKIASQAATGVYNISGADFMSIYELVNRVADFWHLDKSLIKRASSADIKQPAKRPPITGFIIEKANKQLNYEPHIFEEGLQLVADQLRQNAQL